MKNRWAWAVLAPPLAVALLFFVGPLVYLFRRFGEEPATAPARMPRVSHA